MNISRKWSPSEAVLNIALIGILILIGIRGIIPMWSMYILPDEFGYLAAGAWMAGYDWSALAANSYYYSYGYGFVIAVIMKFTESPEWIYKGILFFNIILICVNFLLLNGIGKKLVLGIDAKVRLIISFTMMFYISNIIYVKIAWPEILLMTLYLVIIRLIIELKDNPNTLVSALLGVCSVFIYMVHQRTIGITIAVVITVAILAVARKLSGKQLIIFSLAFLGTFLIHIQMKQAVQEGVYSYSTLVDTSDLAVNDFAGQKDKVIKIFTSFSGFFETIVSFVGKLYYLISASFGLFFWGCYACLKKIVYNWKRKEPWESMEYLFIFLSMLGCVGVASIYMKMGGRQDILIYGRYSETVLLPFLLLGFFEFWKEKTISKIHFFFFLVLLLLTWIVNGNLQHLDSLQYNTISALGTSFFFKDGVPVGNAVWYCTMLCVIISTTLFCLRKLPIFAGVIVSASLLIGVWSCGSFSYTSGVYGTQAANHEFEFMSQLVETYSQDNVITYIDNAESGIVDRIQVSHLQFNSPKRKFLYIGAGGSLIECDSEFAVVLKSPQLFEVMSNGYRIIREYRNLVLMVQCGSNAEHHLLSDGVYLQSDTIDGNIVYHGIDIKATYNGNYTVDGIISDGTANYLVFGPYLPLEPGNYEFEIYMKLESAEAEHLGTYDIVDGNIIYEQKELSVSMFNNLESAVLHVDFEPKEALENMEIRIVVTEGTKLEVNKIILKRK